MRMKLNLNSNVWTLSYNTCQISITSFSDLLAENFYRLVTVTTRPNKIMVCFHFHSEKSWVGRSEFYIYIFLDTAVCIEQYCNVLNTCKLDTDTAEWLNMRNTFYLSWLLRWPKENKDNRYYILSLPVIRVLSISTTLGNIQRFWKKPFQLYWLEKSTATSDSVTKMVSKNFSISDKNGNKRFSFKYP